MWFDSYNGEFLYSFAPSCVIPTLLTIFILLGYTFVCLAIQGRHLSAETLTVFLNNLLYLVSAAMLSLAGAYLLEVYSGAILSNEDNSRENATRQICSCGVFFPTKLRIGCAMGPVSSRTAIRMSPSCFAELSGSPRCLKADAEQPGRFAERHFHAV